MCNLHKKEKKIVVKSAIQENDNTSRISSKSKKKQKKKPWYDYLWIASVVYLFLGLFNILFAWLGIICFITPIWISLTTSTKLYCNQFCGRGKLFQLLGSKYKFSRNRSIPSWMKSKAFRYGFLTFFMTMFGFMVFNTVMVFTQTRNLSEVITILWMFKVPWDFANPITITPWINQFAFGFYSVMLTSTILGFITMHFYKPRSWCVYCPMGTMTQLICQGKEALRNPTDQVNQ